MSASDETTAELPPEWVALVRTLNDYPPRMYDVGVRDPDYPCSAFDPLPDGVKPMGGGDCMGDGHYLCRECSQFSAASERWPSEDCPECPKRNYADGCPRCDDWGVIDQPGWERDRSGRARVR